MDLSYYIQYAEGTEIGIKSQAEFEEMMEEKAFGNIVPCEVMISGEKVNAVYRNDGCHPFKDGENLSEYECPDEDDETEIMDWAYGIIQPGAPYATFVGFFKIVESKNMEV